MKKLIIILCLSNLCFTQISSQNLKTGLAAYYPFSGNARDESGNNNNGVVSGVTSTNGRDGSLNGAYLFDGVDDFIQIPYNRDLLPNSDAKTYCFWIKFNANKTSEFIFQNGDADYSSGQFRIGLSSAGDIHVQLHSYWGYGGGSKASNMYQKVGNFDVSRYHHFVVTISKRDVSYFLDGVLVSNKSWNLDYKPFDSNYKIQIGRYYNSAAKGYANYFNGIVDEISIYNRILTNSEIQAISNSTTTNYEKNTQVQVQTQAKKSDWEELSSTTCNATTIRIKRKTIETEFKKNYDGTKFFKSFFGVQINDSFYEMPNSHFVGVEKTGNFCALMDNGILYLYILGYTGSGYSMNGTVYKFSSGTITTEQVFSTGNKGWYSYFLKENGAICISHFAYAGYYSCKATRNSYGIWSDATLNKIEPDVSNRICLSNPKIFCSDAKTESNQPTKCVWSFGQSKPEYTYTWTGGCLNGKLDGEGTLIWHVNGVYKGTYTGNMKEGLANGFGKTQYANGDIYEGNFVNGIPNGHGEFHHGDAYFKGEFKDFEFWNGYGRSAGGQGLFDYSMHDYKWVNGEKILNDYKNASSSDNSSSSSSGDDNERDNDDKKSEMNYENIEHPGVDKVDDWEEENSLTDGRYYVTEVTFEDGINGFLYKGGSSGDHFIENSGGANYYYKNYDAALRALYVYKKYGEIIKRGAK